LNPATAAPPEVTRFLREHPPFDALPAEAVERVAGALEVEFHAAGTTILSQGAGPVEHLRVVRSGAVAVIHDGRLLDLLGEGETFGHASMLSGLPSGFEARAVEDTLCYRLDGETAEELLSKPAGLRFVARSLTEFWTDETSTNSLETPHDPAGQPVGTLVRGEPVVCEPDTSIREAARRMTSASARSLVVKLADGTLGILTDRDLRTRVIAGGLPGDAPVVEAMTHPAYTVSPDRLGSEVLLEMLDRGFRHFPVVTAKGEVLGVVEDVELITARTRSPFFLRQRIARAESVEDLAAAAAELRPAVVALHDARVAALNIMAVYAVVVDALTRRLLELAVAETGAPPAPFAWLALGSQARREAVPSSDVDSAFVWFGDAPEEEVRPVLQGFGQTVAEGLRRCGFHEDAHGATASNRLFVRSVDSWQNAARSWISDPTQEQALILVSVLVDSRPVWGIHTGTPVSDTFRLTGGKEQLLRMLARFALSHRPPTGFLRGLVVEHSGEHRGRLDLKHGGIIPIVDLARWAGMAAGVASASTMERLRAAGEAETLPSQDVHTLVDAFELFSSLRVEHQVAQVRAGVPPDDHLDPSQLSDLTRSYLRGAFRAVASIQKRVAAGLNAGIL
jgi:CBS domain-containing protein